MASIDPDFRELSSLLHNCADDCLAYLSQAYKIESPGFTQTQFKPTALQTEPANVSEIYSQIQRLLLAFPQYLNNHPGFAGWSVGAGNALNILSEMLTASINASVQTPAQTLSLIEKEVVEWIKQIIHMDASVTGLFTSGTSTGNLMALTVARHFSDPAVKLNGNSKLKRTQVWGSRQTHLTVPRALGIMGLGENNFRTFPSNADASLNVSEVATALANAKDSEKPFCIVANLGTTEFGAFDKLEPLIDICRQHQIWLHVDAAWGFWLSLDPKRQHLVKGIEQADSISLDFHKWPGAPIGTGLSLFTGKIHLDEIFSIPNTYLQNLSDSQASFGTMGIELSRPARALPVWILLRYLGTKQIGDMVQERCDMAELIYNELSNVKEIEWAQRVLSNIAVFRFKLRKSEEENNILNQKITKELWQEGQFMPSLLNLNGIIYLRFCLINHRLNKENILLLLKRLNSLLRENF